MAGLPFSITGDRLHIYLVDKIAGGFHATGAPALVAIMILVIFLPAACGKPGPGRPATATREAGAGSSEPFTDQGPTNWLYRTDLKQVLELELEDYFGRGGRGRDAGQL